MMRSDENFFILSELIRHRKFQESSELLRRSSSGRVCRSGWSTVLITTDRRHSVIRIKSFSVVKRITRGTLRNTKIVMHGNFDG